MNFKEFQTNAHHLVDWMTRYLQNVETYPVKSQKLPEEIYKSLPTKPPEIGENKKVAF